MPLTNPFKHYFTANFLKNYPSWFRLEPRARSDDFGPGPEARTADPLWILTRQWQFGEFQAQDAGSPGAAYLHYNIHPIQTIRLGDSEKAQPLHNFPMETLVERERQATDYRFRVQMGQQFERLLRTLLGEAGMDDDEIQEAITFYRSEFEFTLPPDNELVEFDEPTRRFIRFMAGRVCDGELIINSQMMVDTSKITYPDSFTTADKKEKVNEAFEKLKEWQTNLLTEPTDKTNAAWDNPQLHYRFETNLSDKNPKETALVVSDYRNGELDWYSFATKADSFEVGGKKKEFETIPTRLDIADQSPRWWAIADRQLNLSRLENQPTDLAKLLFTEFVSDYSDDWFQIPLEVPIGSVVQINTFKVSDVFGIEMELDVARNDGKSPLDRWEMFSLGKASSPEAAGVSVLLIPPLSGYRQESEPIEEVRFTRDEGANMVWGIEQIVRNGLGQPLQGREARRALRVRQLEFEIAGLQRDLEDALRDSADTSLTPENRQGRSEDAKEIEIQIAKLKAELEQSVSADGAPLYQLSTTVPENWIPFMPYNIGDFLNGRTGSIALRRAKMWRNVDDTEPRMMDAMTTLLDVNGNNLLWLEEEAVPRAGVRVVLTRQRVRWHDGTTYVWLGRKVLTGRGGENSGLRFDVTK